MRAEHVLRSTSYWAARYRRTWRRSLVPSVIGPCLYMVVMGKVMGSLVNRSSGASDKLGGLDYLSYVAPAIVAVTALMTASGEATSPVVDALRTKHTYACMQATPLDVRDIIAGQFAWMAIRIAGTSTLLAALLVALGGAHSWLVVVTVPVAVLTGMAIACGVAAFAARQRHTANMLGWQRFGALPMMLFGGVYFPISTLPVALRLVVQLTPLWHGVVLCRQLSAGTATLAAAWPHVAYLCVVMVIGWRVALSTFQRELVH
ncbi:MAG: ABC-type multidrug transport system, permease component [Ilumatobacteraceae bacterium]|nr:ABC-type multidrug transport system, permease component [Ilumatobacteraceae bacterium]